MESISQHTLHLYFNSTLPSNLHIHGTYDVKSVEHTVNVLFETQRFAKTLFDNYQVSNVVEVDHLQPTLDELSTRLSKLPFFDDLVIHNEPTQLTQLTQLQPSFLNLWTSAVMSTFPSARQWQRCVLDTLSTTLRQLRHEFERNIVTHEALQEYVTTRLLFCFLNLIQL